MKSFSLTRRLIVTALLIELCSSAVLVVSAGVYEGVSRFRAFDVMLRGRADSMLGAVQDAEDEHDNVMLDGTQAMAPANDIYAVLDERGRLLGHSQNWPDPVPAFAQTNEFRKLRLDGRRYRVLRREGLRIVDPGHADGGISRRVQILYGARTEPVWESIERATLFYALLSAVLLAVSGWLMLRLLRRGLQPLRELAAQASKVTVRTWEFRPSPEVRAVEELSPLIAALEAALGGLERSFEQQQQFVSDAAHELKTSVAVLKSSLQVMSLRPREAMEYRAGLGRAEVDCERMERLVSSMLTLAAIEAEAGAQPAATLTEVNSVVSEVAEHLRTTAELADVRIRFTASPDAWVQADREKLRLLFSNLIHNAVQHSAAGAEVRASVNTSGDHLVLFIEDDGDGIPPEALPYVFDRFYRSDVSRSRRTGGTGLGLAIAKAAADAVRGEICIQSEPGHGARVKVVLPAVRPPFVAPVAETPSALVKVDVT